MKTDFSAVLLAAASLSLVSAASGQDSPVAGGFRVDVPTGALTPLESAKAMEQKQGGYLYCYLDSASSPVTFRNDEPLAFAYRWDGSRRDVEDVRKHALRDSSNSRYQLEFLSVSEGGRYGTGKFVPMDREPYGEIVSDVNAKKPKHVGQSFLLKPRGALAPGEYVFAYGGMAWKAPYGGYAQCNPWPVSAFRVVEGAPVTPPASPPSPSTSERPAAPTNSASDIQRLRRAAEEGDAVAQASLGNLHFLGSGVLQDYVEAHKWLNIAAARLDGDDRKSCAELRDKVAALMTPVERADAQRRAADWMESFQQRKP